MLDDNRPSLIFDSESIRSMRQEVQKPWEKEEFWAYYVMRRFSIYVSSALAKRTNISPNALTILGIVFGLAAAAFDMIGSPSALLCGFLFYQMCYFFDCVDGEVARLSKRLSQQGEWLDIGLNYAMAMANIAVVYGLFHSVSSVLFGVALFLTLLTTFALILASDGAMAVFQRSSSQVSVSLRKKSRITDSAVFLFLTDLGFHLGVFVCCLIWLAWDLKMPLLIWTGYFIVVNVLKAFFKLRANRSTP